LALGRGQESPLVDPADRELVQFLAHASVSSRGSRNADSGTMKPCKCLSSGTLPVAIFGLDALWQCPDNVLTSTIEVSHNDVIWQAYSL